MKTDIPVIDPEAPAPDGIIGTQSSLRGLKLSSLLRLFKMERGNS